MIPDISLIPVYWNSNFRSLLGYLEEALRGIQDLFLTVLQENRSGRF
jgi:PAS domain-containing protein